jgi:hypothetical protein
MQIADFVKLYQSRTDEELIQLAVEQEQLTSEARLALQGELSKRAIRIPHRSEVSHDVGPPNSAERLQTGNGLHEGIGDFITEVLRTYHSHFWLFFKITAPAVSDACAEWDAVG